MLRVGITGGIGSGKTTVARMFQVLGVHVFYADVEARRLMTMDPALRDALVQRFGSEVFINGELDRSELAGIVFKDPQALAALNALVHPAVRRAFQEWSTRQQGSYVLMEAAIMAENEGYRAFDQVIAVSCPEEIRVQRVMLRDGVGAEKVMERVRQQASDEDRSRIAQHVVHNDGSRLVIPQVLAIHAELLTLAAR